MNDNEIHRILREVPSEMDVPPSFAREVWARIEAEEALTPAACISRLMDSFLTWLAKPVPALVTVSASVALGAMLALAGSANSHADGVTEQELAYVRSIVPPGSHLGHHHP